MDVGVVSLRHKRSTTLVVEYESPGFGPKIRRTYVKWTHIYLDVRVLVFCFLFCFVFGASLKLLMVIPRTRKGPRCILLHYREM